MSTVIDTPVSSKVKAERKLELKKKHDPILSQLGYDYAFTTKWIFGPRDNRCFSLLPSDLKKKTDIFLELTTSNIVSTDPERTLYRWAYNPSWEEAYEFVEDKGYYLVPATELKKVTCIEDITGVAKAKIEDTISLSEVLALELHDVLKRYIHQVIKESK